MQTIDEQQLIRNLAYQAWLERGQPVGSPEIDWDRAQQLFQLYRHDITAQAEVSAPRAAESPATKTGKKARARPRHVTA